MPKARRRRRAQRNATNFLALLLYASLIMGALLIFAR